MSTQGQWSGSWQGEWFGALDINPGSMSGAASLSITTTGLLSSPTVDAPTKRHAGGYKLRKGYLIKGRRYFLSDDELAVHVANILQEVSRGEVREITAGKPKVISKRAWDAIKPMERLNALSDMLATKLIAKPAKVAELVIEDDEDDELFLMLM